VAKKHWCKYHDPKPNSNGNCGDCKHYNMTHSYCPKNYSATTAIVHPPTKPRGKKYSRVTMTLK
jgi:hypothetical protein